MASDGLAKATDQFAPLVKGVANPRYSFDSYKAWLSAGLLRNPAGNDLLP